MNDFLTNEGHIGFEVLIDHVDGILDSKSQEKIEEHIKKCTECSGTIDSIKWYYETYGKDRKNLENYLFETKKGILEALDDVLQEPHTEPKKILPLWQNISRVAAIVLLLIIPVLFIINSSKSSTALLNEYLSSPYHKPPVLRGDVDQNIILWNRVAFQYESKEYDETITSLKAIIDRKETLSMAHFYTGLCYLYLESPNPGKAISHLQKVANGENPFKEQGLWYLSLAYLQNSQETLCIQTLESIKGYKYKEAQKLLSELN
ncbi:hypothetical protein FVB32_08350 [Flagellimonas hymeniacidonis]|uniref:Zinc-finger domain-containing protein n=1 Tax=Flagellimonas hymeniacidonis TaxID=2603628 RepID=A0A5C8V992_9FLAO|nr:zf-HC2 domain-containing protein [Flagellimonas hymeniacidonis]TXN38291.1 hypothetical protein FVB32_08350 [Flagellimonas hymeniacidonis]